MNKTLLAAGYFVIVAGLIVVGGSGCGKKVISDEEAGLHGPAAGALVQPIHEMIEEGGTVVLVHSQGDKSVLLAWVNTLQTQLDSRFSLEVFGPAEMADAASGGYSVSHPLLKALKAHPGCVAVVSTLPMDLQDARRLPAGRPPIFALEWPFPDTAAPLIRKGVVAAGVFDFYPDMYPGFTPDPAILIEGKYLLLDRKSIGSLGGR